MSAQRKVFYNSWIPSDLKQYLDKIRPDHIALMTLDEDNDQERLDKISQAEVAVVAAKPLTEKILQGANRLHLVHHQGVGYQDTIALQELRKMNARLAITPVGTTDSVAEHTLLLILAALRKLPRADAELRKGKWLINEIRLESHELRNRKVGIIGMGRIGQSVARLVRAFGCSGLYYDPHVHLSQEEEAQLQFAKASLHDVLRYCDVITLHLPHSAETHHLLNHGAFEMMTAGTILVNTARGGLVDQQALLTALRDGKLGAAGLDVYEIEPPGPNNPLYEFPNVVLTPHIAAGTLDAFASKWKFIFENITTFFDHGTLQYEVKL